MAEGVETRSPAAVLVELIARASEIDRLIVIWDSKDDKLHVDASHCRNSDQIGLIEMAKDLILHRADEED